MNESQGFWKDNIRIKKIIELGIYLFSASTKVKRFSVKMLNPYEKSLAKYGNLMFPEYSIKYYNNDSEISRQCLFIAGSENPLIYRTIYGENAKTRIQTHKDLPSLDGYLAYRTDGYQTKRLVDFEKDDEEIKNFLKFFMLLVRTVKILDNCSKRNLDVIQRREYLKIYYLRDDAYQKFSIMFYESNMKLIVDGKEFSLNYLESSNKEINALFAELKHVLTDDLKIQCLDKDYEE